MNKEVKKTSEKASSNFEEPQPKGKVDQGEKAVKKPEDEVYNQEPAKAKTENPAKAKENSEQPVHSVKK
ncbi:MAG: hypothetical protein V4546_13220 [Bacteroidota bacterium]|uniref:Uncharacterized protein n=1 Tax=Pedobacter cryotolerans TaxID=2571270 RepID=A0A4U1C695_9SPHI|nr:hypothetical protein [Pedobacter cryotolerans]TKB99841.1 hypothetical protein FA045_10360 [Pedobacter cryotolerans]